MAWYGMVYNGLVWSGMGCCWMLPGCLEGWEVFQREGRPLSGVSLKTVVFLPAAAECDTPSIPSQNNYSPRGEQPPLTSQPPPLSLLH